MVPSMRRLFFYGLIVLSFCTTNRVWAAVPKPYVEHYGVYMNGHKVGWFRSEFATGAQYRLSTHMEAQMVGLGRKTTLEVDEKRFYNVKNGKLEKVDFSQSAETGRVVVLGTRKGDGMVLKITAGGATQERTMAVHETLNDALALFRLARAGKGAVATHQFDPSLMKEMKAKSHVSKSERRQLGGVDQKVYHITTEIPEMGVTQGTWVDGTGRVLETKIGGFLVVRLESPDVAKKRDYSQDLLVSAVVKVPSDFPKIKNLQSLVLQFQGSGDFQFPASSFQRAEKSGLSTTVTLTQAKMPRGILLDEEFKKKSIRVKSDLESTPFIQSEDSSMIKRAKQVVGDARTLDQAIIKLTQFVHDHVKDQYVPAYSNALEALQTGIGDCTEHSILFVALARALGIPSRVAVGIAYWAYGGGFGWHAWSEVWTGTEWLPVDPTWGQPVADLSHVKLADGGPMEQARIIMLLGQLKLQTARGL